MVAGWLRQGREAGPDLPISLLASAFSQDYCEVQRGGRDHRDLPWGRTGGTVMKSLPTAIRRPALHGTNQGDGL